MSISPECKRCGNELDRPGDPLLDAEPLYVPSLFGKPTSEANS
jgi:hypothetical protein